MSDEAEAIHVHSLSGELLLTVELSRITTVRSLQRILEQDVMVPIKEQKLLLGAETLSADQDIAGLMKRGAANIVTLLRGHEGCNLIVRIGHLKGGGAAVMSFWFVEEESIVFDNIPLSTTLKEVVGLLYERMKNVDPKISEGQTTTAIIAECIRSSEVEHFASCLGLLLGPDEADSRFGSTAVPWAKFGFLALQEFDVRIVRELPEETNDAKLSTRYIKIIYYGQGARPEVATSANGKCFIQ